MILLHAGIVEGSTVIWAERQMTDAPSRANRAGKSFREAGGEHPFAAGFDDLLTVLSGLVDEKGAQTVPVDVWLPSSGDCPVPSKSLLAPEDYKYPKSTKLAPWRVNALRVEPLVLEKLFKSAHSKHVFYPGVLLADEFLFFSLLLQFGASLVVRQKYLPGVVYKDGDYYGRWQPVLLKDDPARLQRLADMLPPVVRAVDLNFKRSSPPPGRPADTVRQFLDSLTDSLVRDSLKPKHVATSVPARARAKRLRFDSVHDCWLAALKSVDGLMNHDPIELAAFAIQVEEWQRPATLVQAAPFRLCFRLEEPYKPDPEESVKAPATPAEPPWSVSYHLQSTRDQSLLIPARDAWVNSGVLRDAVGKTKFKPREYLLTSLAQASRLSEPIAQSLLCDMPEGFHFSSSDAFQFLSDTAGVLEEAGFGILLPSWTKKKKRLKFMVDIEPRFMVKGTFMMDAIANFDWKVAIGDRQLSFREMMAIAEMKTSLVNIRGEWVYVNREEIASAIEFLQTRTNDSGTIRDGMKMAIGALQPGGMAVDVDVRAHGWAKDLIARMRDSVEPEHLAAPDSFVGQLRPYQMRGYSWLSFLSGWGLGACLADDMGLGKTIQTLALVLRQRENGETRPVLLICPNSVVTNWSREAAKFTPGLPVMVHHGGGRKKGAEFRKQAANQGIVISTYALMHRDLAHLRDIHWAGIVLDEAQNIKNPDTKQAGAATQLKGDFRIALTGTPVENNVGDLWSIMNFLNPGLLGSTGQFLNNFFKPIHVAKSAEARARLRKVTQPFILRRLKTDRSVITDLPDKLEMKLYCSLTKEQVTLYEGIVRDFDQEILFVEGKKRLGLIFATLIKLKQVCNHPVHFLADHSRIDGRSGKLDRLTEMLDEVLATGERSLIFTQFVEMGEIIKRHLEAQFGEDVCFYHGGLNKKQRDALVDRFQSGQGPSVFILSLKAGGLGLNLTAANHVFHYDRWWNPAVEQQASDRAYRIGQTRNVQVHKFICAGTLEEKIDELITSKRELAEDVVGSADGWMSRLSNNDLKNVFSLSREFIID